ncbi:D-2-hydroxyacid dehydrogenase [Rubrobacter taiwanensis]|jgi:phosphoglycerate dehydrogenase-like enzyme|uniref:D-2-hydroxyacid dehydrogenase n=1 Tax=Rubrobacter taiwanensis TaxID=185139 RepID=A0A4R1BT71_9ACTN|nr:D-2-hydroxyacid dehydrogenase [Rubrobacter taiwanensis]TCJ20445.1 D-2-hydroxyacid dehydrogenase [Rubrobacter taiwanensis]
MVTVVIAGILEEEHVERIRELEGVRVLHDPELVPPPRWPGDNVGDLSWRRTPEQEERWLGMLAEAEVLYDFDRAHLRDLTEVAPKLRWVQASFAGAGEVAEKAGLRGTGVTVTTASGVFSRPLAEFTLAAMLAHVKQFARLERDKGAKRWRELPADTLEGKTLCVVGFGSIGQEIAHLARPFGVRILGVKRSVRKDDPALGLADELYATEDLRGALGAADYVAVTLPHTPETRRLIDAGAFRAMKPGAYLVNVGRGQVVDEAALAEALRSGRLSGAALDVFEVEPLPEESPLWELENVIVSPHSTCDIPHVSNRLQADLFIENLRRYLAGESLRNVLDMERLY